MKISLDSLIVFVEEPRWQELSWSKSRARNAREMGALVEDMGSIIRTSSRMWQLYRHTQSVRSKVEKALIAVRGLWR